jgi:hypothetical protein
VSLQRRIRKAAVRREPFLLEAQRERLSQRLRQAAYKFGAVDTVRFLGWLREQRRGYDPAFDGPSELMRLVDDIAAFERKFSTAQGSA